MGTQDKIPVILLGPGGSSSFRVFNPNDWNGRSKEIVQSCAAELSCVHFGQMLIEKICRYPVGRCQPHLDTLLNGSASVASLEKCTFYGQDLELHLAIEGFFASVKTTLDLIVQLLESEDLVGARLKGFNKLRNEPGGRVLAVLNSNARAGCEHACREISDLIAEHKRRWIDGVVRVRDNFAHPPEGTRDLMFEIRFQSRDGELLLEHAEAPTLGDHTIIIYTQDRLADLAAFAVEFLRLVRGSGSTARP